MSALIVPACLLAYAVMTLLAARWRYAAIRPYTEPLACDDQAWHANRGHLTSCYRRSGYVNDKGEAVAFALLLGVVWPFIPLAIGLSRFIAAGGRQLPEELAAEIKRLEAENERLKREQEQRRA